MLAAELFAAQGALMHACAVLGLDVVEHAAFVRVGKATGGAHEPVHTQHHQHLQQVVLILIESFIKDYLWMIRCSVLKQRELIHSLLDKKSK